jgi:hypothetical protein
MRELSEVTGFCEHKLNTLKGESGFPLCEKKTTLRAFQKWAFNRSNSAEGISQDSHTFSHHSHSSASKSYERFR